MKIKLKSMISSSFIIFLSVNLHAEEYNINFNEINYEVKTIKQNNKDIKYRAYENIVYVKNPVDIKYQTLNFYVPEEYFEGKKINGYDIKTVPIFFPNSIGGYMPATAGTLDGNQRGGIEGKRENASAVALAKSYVVAMPGARGRTTKDENGIFTGKAPAAIVDLKAAVKYLHFNDSKMAGDANKIISNGTSAGGALSALLGASVESKDYESYLKELGAADASDSIFAVSTYCPITNLEHADMAYEWQFNKIINYKSLKITQDTDFKMKREFVLGAMTKDRIALSKKLKEQFPAYVNSLNLKDEKGNQLTLDKEGNGSFKEYYKTVIIKSAQKELDKGTDLSSFSWLSISDGKVVDIDFDAYVAHVGRMKVTPAFDDVALTSGENNLFGTKSIDNQHFTKFSYENSTVKGSMADSDVIKLMNPMNYINRDNLPKNWRIRHGEMDADTSLAISLILSTKLKNNGYNVDYASPWAISHSGDYDLDELFTWIDNISK